MYLKSIYNSLKRNTILNISVRGKMESTQKVNFVNTVQSFGLPVDENPKNKPAQVRGKNYSKVRPTPLE
jgi:hypothetical protein